MKIVRILKDKFKVTPLGKLAASYRRNHAARDRKSALAALEHFGMTGLADAEREKLIADMYACSAKYHFTFDEYFLFHLQDKTEEERYAFVSDSDRVVYCEKFNKPSNQYIFDNKVVTAKTFAKYFKREYVFIESKKNTEDLARFLEKHRRIMIKPLSSASGHGVRMVELADGQDAMKLAAELVAEYCSGVFGDAIAEQLIVQDERMAKLHPQSVNTIRITTIRLDDRVVIFHPNLRVGRGDSCIDNAGAGGILGSLDAATGKVIFAGDKAGNTLPVHPETGEQILGFQVPDYDKLVAFVNELAQVVPSNRYTGWDVALTPDGWLLVEANARGQWGAQIMLQQGFRAEVEGYLKELGLK